MPIYRYACETCNRIADEFRAVIDRDQAPTCCGARMSRRIMAPMVTPEIQAFRTVNWDQETKRPVVISSRAQKREFMKRNDLVELGNEPIRKPKRDWSDAPDAPMVSIEEAKRRGFVEEGY